MWKDSNELFEHALRELQVTITNNEMVVKILLKEHCKPDAKEMRRIQDKLEIKKLAETLREEFSKYDIHSVVSLESESNFSTLTLIGECIKFYPLVWVLTLQKK